MKWPKVEYNYRLFHWILIDCDLLQGWAVMNWRIKQTEGNIYCRLWFITREGYNYSGLKFITRVEYMVGYRLSQCWEILWVVGSLNG
jgi:hypothetical protein